MVNIEYEVVSISRPSSAPYIIYSPVAALVEAPHRLPDKAVSPPSLGPHRPHEAGVEAVGEEGGGQLPEIQLQVGISTLLLAIHKRTLSDFPGVTG